MSMPSVSAPAALDRTFDWTQQLQLFLQGRLRTTPYRVIAKQNPLVAFPHAPLNTQFLIDGVVLAISDHGDALGKESYFAVVNHLRSCWGRWEQVCSYVASMSTGGSSTVAVGTNHRQYSYGVMAALQDLLLAWYVVDAVLKSSDLLVMGTNNMASSSLPSGVSAALERELPSFVASMMPTLCVAAPSPYVVAALAEYRPRFEDMMVSWYVAWRRLVASGARTGTNGTNETSRMGDLLRRCEVQVKHKVRGDAKRARPNEGPLDSAASTVEETIDEDLTSEGGADALVAIIRAATAPAATTVSVSKFGHAEDGPPLPASLHGKALVDVFVQQAFDRSRTPLSCKHCGAPCADESARVAHLRMHFLTHEQRDTDTAVRLRFPSLDAFLEHVPYTSPDAGAAGRVPVKLFCKTTEAHKPFFSAVVSVRKAADGVSNPDATSKKRPRSVVGVVVTDVASPYRCAQCLEVIRPVQDSFSKDWVLPNCERVVQGGAEVVVHSGCRP